MAGQRLAFVTPLPPSPSGIADYSLDVAALLHDRYPIDFFVPRLRVEHGRLPRGSGMYPAAELRLRHGRGPYRAIVYQLGNSPEHADVYGLLPLLPGLLVLHDLVLHHARARMFLESPAALAYKAEPFSAERREAAQHDLVCYRDEVRYSHPEGGEFLADVQLETSGSLLPYSYPLFRLPVEAARLVAVHNAFMQREVSRCSAVEAIRLPMPMRRLETNASAVAELRRRLGFVPEDVVVGCFGLLTAEKRVETVARAVVRAREGCPRLRLLLVGHVVDRPGLDSLLERVGAGAATVVTGRVPFETLGTHIEAVDLAAHLRYPTARETSAALLRLLAHGRPTAISDLEHQRELPRDAVLRLDVADEEGDLTRALLRLAEQPALRSRLGAAAARHVLAAHAPEVVAAAWTEAIERTAQLPNPAPHLDWPAHWRR